MIHVNGASLLGGHVSGIITVYGTCNSNCELNDLNMTTHCHLTILSTCPRSNHMTRKLCTTLQYFTSISPRDPSYQFQ